MGLRKPFDFCHAMRLLCADVVSRVDEYQHVHMEHVAVTFAQARSDVRHGLQAKLTPMRFENGSLYMRRGQRQFTVQRLFQDNHEVLYILTFYLPRFQNQPFREKLVTIFHELHHISPNFDGDIRRHSGRYHVHTHSQREYDRQMDGLVEDYLQHTPPTELYQFLKKNFRGLQKDHGAVVGLQLPIPKLIPVLGARSA